MNITDELFNISSNYILADEQIIMELSEGAREKLIDFMYSVYNSRLGPISKTINREDYIKNMRYSSIKFIFSYCPNCHDVTLICNSYTGMDEIRGLKFCINCGDAHFMEKAIISNNRIKVFRESIDISNFKNDLSRRLHLQQLVVMIATQLEFFLKDYYAAILNMRLIKFRHSAYKRFIKDCGNDFINPGKTHKRLKDELSIPLKELIGKNRYKLLNKLSSYRNVIIHNNGFADLNFISNGNAEYSLGEEVQIYDCDIDDYLRAFKMTLIILMQIYNDEFIPILTSNINRYIIDIIDKSIYIDKDNKNDLLKNLL